MGRWLQQLATRSLFRSGRVELQVIAVKSVDHPLDHWIAGVVGAICPLSPGNLLSFIRLLKSSD